MWSLLFPGACVWCGEDLPVGEEPGTGFCPACREQLALGEAFPRCRWCAARLQAEADQPRCRSCRNWPPWLGPVVSLGPYRGLLRRCVLRSKTVQGEFLCAALSQLLVRRFAGKLLALEPQLVVPVPLHWMRRWRRGTSPAETLAQVVARRLQLRWRGVLRRVRATPPQSRLPARLRRRNVRGAFRLRRVAISGKRVLLVDDIMTTGATLRHAARVLRAAGTQHVVVAVLARAQEPQVNTARS